MGFLSILRDSAKIHGDSQGFSGFPQKPYEVSGVERVKVGVKVDPRRWYDFQPGNESLWGPQNGPVGPLTKGPLATITMKKESQYGLFSSAFSSIFPEFPRFRRIGTHEWKYWKNTEGKKSVLGLFFRSA